MLSARLCREVADLPPDDAAALPPAKAALAHAIAALNRAQEELEEAQKPVDKLAHARAGATLHEAAELRSEIARLRAEHEAELNAWVDAGGNGKRPPPPAELVPLERALGRIAAAARKAEIRFPLAYNVMTATERIRSSMLERDRELRPATVDAADPTLRAFEQAVTVAQSAAGRLLGLVGALREAALRAGDDGRDAYAAAAKIEERMNAATASRRAPSRSGARPVGDRAAAFGSAAEL